MFNKQKNITLNSRIFKLIFFPLLISTPFLIPSGNLKAGLEFQWDKNPYYRQLKYLSKNSDRRAKNKIFFFLRPFDRRDDLLKINFSLPKRFDSTLKQKNIKLCQVKIGGFETRTKCIKDIPADIEINENDKTLDIYPYSPIKSNKESYAIVMKIFNPKKSGLYQFHSFGQAAGKTPTLNYLGSWTIRIN
tara:strand:+ start:792 stop:1361 length:570 start_codon:yes stop_codon:yes gene_type:complete